MDSEERLKNFLSRVENSKKILLSNRRKILEFIKDRKVKNNAPNTCIKYLYPLYQMNALGWIGKNFDKLTKEDIQDVLIKIENREWSPKTKKNFKLTLKVFYKWLESEDKFGIGEYPEKVKFISTTIPKRDRKELSFVDIVTREEVIRMAQKTTNTMHKAFLWVAFESGGRPEEVLNLKKSDVKFDNYGTIIFLNGVKSKRPMRLISATEPLRDWLRKHPLNDKNDFDVWVTQFSKKKNKNDTWTKLGNAGANRILKVLAKRSGIEKRITIYSLRKGRATELASNAHISRSVLHSLLGWEEGSSISKSYVKLSLKDVDNSILRASGIEPTEKEEIESFVECSLCGAKNSPDSLYCQNCDKPLIVGDLQQELKGLIKQLRGERRSLVKELLKDSDFEKEMMEKFRDWMNSKEVVEEIKKTTGY